ncbi:MAG: 16S rRNA (guanine(966)-N(2))-methyltransferase RsmD [Christensenellaceae bacterium]
MRIIAGKHKGKILKEFKGESIRPTSDKARQALFNILQFRIQNCIFLDAFCGTGAVGIEAISRGAKSVYMTDISVDSVNLTRQNLQSVKENARVFLQSAESFLKSTDIKFDIIFIDPPYDSKSGRACLEIIAERKLLNACGRVIYEHRRGDVAEFDKLPLISVKRYGIAEFLIYGEE